MDPATILLATIWRASALLVTLSSVTMAGLILRRVLRNRQEHRIKKRKAALTLFVMLYLDSPTDDETVRKICRDFDLKFLHEVASGVVSNRRRSAKLRTDLNLLREIIQDLLGSVGGNSRERLIALLRETHAREVCLADLRHKHPGKRLDAVNILSLLPDPEVIEALRDLLDDEEPEVRLAAARSLIGMGPHLTVDDLVEKLDIGVTIRSRILREIFRHLAARNRHDLAELLERNPPDLIAALALYGLGTTQDFSMIPVIARYGNRASIDVRAESMRALTAIGHPDAEPAVLRGLRDEAWEVRTEAAICAGRIPLPGAIPLLRERLTDREWWPRFRAAEALKAMGGSGMTTLENARLGTGPAAQISDLILAEGSAAA